MHRRSFLCASTAALVVGADAAKAAPGFPAAKQEVEVSYLEDLKAIAVERGDMLQAEYLDAMVAEDLLRALPFLTVTGGALKREGERFTTIKPRSEDTLRIMCGDCDVDAALVEESGDSLLTLRRRMHHRRAALSLVDRLINGDGTAAYAYSIGLKHRIADDAVIAMGGPLRLAVLDQAIEQTNASHLVTSKRMRNLITAASHAQDSKGRAGFVTWETDEKGRHRAFYTTRKGRTVPFLCTDYNEVDAQIIDFNEPGDTTSIYVVALKPEGVAGLMNNAPQVADLGLITTAPGGRDAVVHPPLYRTRVEWLAEGSILGNNAAIRLSGITKAAV